MTLALDLLAALRLEDGRPWGDAATPAQWADARAILDPESPVPYHFLTRSRGYSKTTDLGGISLVAMLMLPRSSRCYALAADRDQGRLLVDAADGFIHRGLSAAFRADQWRITCVRTATTLDVLAADAPGAWGLRPAFVVVDELAQWPTTSGARRLWDAVATAAAKNPATRMAVLTTAGDPAHWSHGVLEHALVDPLWRVHEVKGPPPWMDPDRLAEQRRRLPESQFQRLFMNEWTTSEDRLALPADIAACATLDGPMEPERSRSYAIGVDVGIRRDRTVAAVCHGEAEGDRVRVALDRMQVWAGSRESPVRLSDVEGWLIQAAETFHHARIVVDPWQAIGLAQRLRSRGLWVEEFTFSASSVGRLAVTLHTLIRDHMLAIPNEPELIEELLNVRLRETTPGVLRLDHDRDRHDDMAVAVALAAQHLTASHAPAPALAVASVSGGEGSPGVSWDSGMFSVEA
jgi:phage terminase large subunit-like protein